MLQPPLKKKQLLYLTITALLYNGHSPLPLRIVKSISRLTKCATQASSNLDIPVFQGCCDYCHEEISDLKEY